MSCSNMNCNKNPFDSMNYKVVTCDGDAVCDSSCQAEYEKQKARFFNVTVHSEKRTKNFLMGGPG